jgi:hypothetical protein
MEKILKSILGLLGIVFSNKSSIRTTRVSLITANMPYQFPDMLVPDGFTLSIKAYPTNPAMSLVRIGDTAVTCRSMEQSWPLIPNESISYRVKNAGMLYASATANLCFVVLTVERDR